MSAIATLVERKTRFVMAGSTGVRKMPVRGQIAGPAVVTVQRRRSCASTVPRSGEVCSRGSSMICVAAELPGPAHGPADEGMSPFPLAGGVGGYIGTSGRFHHGE